MLHAVPVEFQRPAPGTWYGGFGDIPRRGAVSRVRYNRQLMRAILPNKIAIAKAVNVSP